MPALSEHDLLLALIALAIILMFARSIAELARRIGQPEVLGELFAGFLLGPSVFGALLPSTYHALFLSGPVGVVLSGFSWLGAIMLLLIAGLEVDLNILRLHVKPGTFAALFAIVPSLIAGAVFARLAFGAQPPRGLFLGIVLSVTAVSVVAKILMERGSMRRGYAQVILAAGVASEVLVWLFVAVVSSFHSSSPLQAGLLHTAYAIAFFLGVITVGRRFVFWAMRRVRDFAWIIRGQLSLVLVLTFLAAAITQALGLHALLGAFTMGVLLGRAPRTNERLLDGLQALTLGLFGPIFFVLAGMRVDITKLGSPAALGTIALLFLVATVVKVGPGALGARLGGESGWEAALVGVGLNLRGGTDVVVAVVGTELGLLTTRAYSMYAVVAILTVICSPMLMDWLGRHAPPSAKEAERLGVEEAERRSYVPKVERVLVPISKQLRGSLAASVVREIAASKHEHGEIFDITELNVQRRARSTQTPGVREARQRLDDASSLRTVELTAQTVPETDALRRILDESKDYDLIAIGARPPGTETALSFGDLQDSIIDAAESDVLVAVNHKADNFDPRSVQRILVPTNGLEHSMAAGDIAGSLAEACNASVTILHVVRPATAHVEETERRQLTESASGVIDELAFRISRLGVRVEKCTEVATDVQDVIVGELRDGSYDLLVLGAVDRGHDGRVYLGHIVQSVLAVDHAPSIVLIGHTENGNGKALRNN